MKIKISIITPTLNNEKTIEKTLQSICNQSFINFEHIVIDGGSSDKTIAVVNKYKKSLNTKIFRQGNSGIYDAINIGIKKTSGDIISILNGDDFYANKDVLKKVYEEFLKNPKVQIILTNVDIIKKKTGKLFRVYHSNFFKTYLFYLGIMPPHPGVFVKKIVYIKIGLFNTKFSSAGDFEFLLRALLINKILFIKLNIVTVIMSSGGKSNKGIKSFFNNTTEIKESLKINNLFSSNFLILLRLPFKLIQIILAKLL